MSKTQIKREVKDHRVPPSNPINSWKKRLYEQSRHLQIYDESTVRCVKLQQHKTKSKLRFTIKVKTKEEIGHPKNFHTIN